MLLVLALTLLNACGMASSKPISVCPPIKEYSWELQNKLADEIEAAPPNAVWPEVVMDYYMVRLSRELIVN